MTAPKKPNPDKDPVKVLMHARAVSLLGSRPMPSLTNGEVEDLQDVAFRVWTAAITEQQDREAARAPRSAGGLRLAAAYGELTEAGRRSVRARHAARARWRRAP